MATKQVYYDTAQYEGDSLGQAVDEIVKSASSERKKFERHWYDNNFFDDGHHFRYLSREQNKIIDLANRANIYNPMRVIPKASRQIRGVVNLLISNDYVPVVYPEKVEKSNYSTQPLMQNGQPIVNPKTGQPLTEYDVATMLSKSIAKKTGHWITEEFKELDFINKLAFCGILTAKNYISYLHIYGDPDKEEINCVVRDAFDVYHMGSGISDLEDSNFVTIAHPVTMSEIKNDDRFDEAQRMKINPDNRHASSEIKEAYMITMYGREYKSDATATGILKESYLKERLCEENIARITKQDDAGDILKGRKLGDIVMRQVYSVGNIWLSDAYIKRKTYPVIDLRFEPGPMYGISLIERFMPANKSLDVVVSRVERYTNTMPFGVIAKKQGEQFDITNQSGAQIVEYKTIPPKFEQQAPLASHIFNYIEYLGQIIDEQGVSLSTLNKIPSGVKAAKAIESLKESEYSNLVMANRMIKNFVKRAAERMLDLADDYFVNPKTVYLLEKGEPQYFDIIGKNAMDKRAKLDVPVEGDVVPISGDYHVEIEIQTGLGYTKEGQKQSAKELGDYLFQLAQAGLVPPKALSQFIETLLEAYEFGSTQDFMESLDEFMDQSQLSDPQIQKLKVALAEVLKDTGAVDQNPQEDIQKVKIGVIEALKDSGILDQDHNLDIQKNKIALAEVMKESNMVKGDVTLNYKDAPEDVKRQMEADAGYVPSKGISPQGVEQIIKMSSKNEKQTKKTNAK